MQSVSRVYSAKEAAEVSMAFVAMGGFAKYNMYLWQVGRHARPAPHTPLIMHGIIA